MSKFIVGTDADTVTRALKEAGAIKEELADVRRVVIDLEAGAPAMIYIETFADNERLTAALTAEILLTGVSE